MYVLGGIYMECQVNVHVCASDSTVVGLNSTQSFLNRVKPKELNQ